MSRFIFTVDVHFYHALLIENIPFTNHWIFLLRTERTRETVIARNFGTNDVDGDLSDDTVPDEAFYYTEVETEVEADDFNLKSPNPPSPPTLSHRDMARYEFSNVNLQILRIR